MIFVYDGVEVNYKVFVKSGFVGEPILFLHGWGGSIKSFEYFARVLSEKRQCIVIDFPPFGESSQIKTPWSVKKYANMVEKLLEYFGLKECSIVAHSFGGRVAIQLAINHSVKVNKMLLTGCAGIKNRSFRVKFSVFKYKVLKFVCKLGLKNRDLLNKLGSKDYRELSPVMKKTFSNIVNYDQRKLIKKIKCSVLLFWGDNDKETPFYFTNFFKKHIKDCGVIKIKGGSHFAYLEEAELFLKVLFTFFS